MKRGLEMAAALVLAASGAALVLVATGRSWVVSGQVCLAKDLCRAYSARGEGAAALRAMGLAALAGVVAVIASRRWGRTLVGAVLAALGAAIMAGGARGWRDPDPARRSGGLWPPDVQVLATGWPLVAATGGSLVLVAGLLVVVRGTKWQRMSKRYDGPQPAATGDGARTDAALWDSLSRGDDPT